MVINIQGSEKHVSGLRFIFAAGSGGIEFLDAFEIFRINISSIKRKDTYETLLCLLIFILLFR